MHDRCCINYVTEVCCRRPAELLQAIEPDTDNHFSTKMPGLDTHVKRSVIALQALLILFAFIEMVQTGESLLLPLHRRPTSSTHRSSCRSWHSGPPQSRRRQLTFLLRFAQLSWSLLTTAMTTTLQPPFVTGEPCLLLQHGQLALGISARSHSTTALSGLC